MSAELRKAILDDAEKCVCADRLFQYGPPEDSFAKLAKLWEAFLGLESGEITAHDVAAMLALLKIARIANNAGHRDSWVDLAGYAACGGGMVKPDPEPEKAFCTSVARHLGLSCMLASGHHGRHVAYDINGRLEGW